MMRSGLFTQKEGTWHGGREGNVKWTSGSKHGSSDLLKCGLDLHKEGVFGITMSVGEGWDTLSAGVMCRPSL